MEKKSKLGLTYLDSLSRWDGKRKGDLAVISRIISSLGNPQDKIKTIHVAGTNGKGSVSAALSSILGALGESVGLYTSPHLETVNERIVVDGTPLTDVELGEVLERVALVAHDLGIDPSYFEALTAAAFAAFGSLDWGVIEVGLGGRFDATNVITNPEISVIVTIGYDHEEVLGHALESIAMEKAGIIKEGGKVVVGPMSEEVLNVISRVCAERCATLVAHGRDFQTKFLGIEGAWNHFLVSGKWGEVESRTRLLGRHQCENMAVAFAVAKELGWETPGALRGLENVFWPGRLEEVNYKTNRILFDCAHNTPAMDVLISFLETTSEPEIELVFGVLGDKNWQKMVDLLLPHIGKWDLVEPNSERALPCSELEDYITKKGGTATSFGKNYDKVVSYLGAETRRGLVCVTGSIYLVGLLRNLLSIPKRPIWLKY